MILSDELGGANSANLSCTFGNDWIVWVRMDQLGSSPRSLDCSVDFCLHDCHRKCKCSPLSLSVRKTGSVNLMNAQGLIFRVVCHIHGDY